MRDIPYIFFCIQRRVVCMTCMDVYSADVYLNVGNARIYPKSIF